MTSIYEKSKNVWGREPTGIVRRAAECVKVDEPTALDLGAGQGRDALFLQSEGFSVTAVDISEEGIKQIKMKDSRINALVSDMTDFCFSKYYNLIISINALHFLEKKSIVKVINNMRNHINDGGVIAVSLLLDNGKMKPGELKEMFGGFNILFYDEMVVEDKGHAGVEYAHQHKIAELIAKKDIFVPLARG